MVGPVAIGNLRECEHGLLAHLGVDVLQRGGQSLERRLIANLTERERGLLPHAGLLVLERGHQRRHGLRVAKLAERERGLLANVVGLDRSARP